MQAAHSENRADLSFTRTLFFPPWIDTGILPFVSHNTVLSPLESSSRMRSRVNQQGHVSGQPHLLRSMDRAVSSTQSIWWTQEGQGRVV